MDTNFKNELAGVVRKNVRDLMHQHHLKTIKLLGEFIVEKGGEATYQRLNNAFGNSPRYSPTEKLIITVENAFELERGSLAKRKQPEKISPAPDSPVTMIQIQCQIGNTKVETLVDDETARRILELIVLGEKT